MSESQLSDLNQTELLRHRIEELENEVEALKAHLFEVEQLETQYVDFSLALSHELRTPLTLISGYAQQLLLRWERTDEVRRREMVEKINVSSRRLSRLIDDMLLLGDVADSALPIHVKDVRLIDDVIKPAIDEISARHGGALPAITLPVHDVTVLADGFRLEQALICIIDNACKHSPPQAAVTISWERSDAEVTICIRDQGPGIDPENLPTLFTRFTRLEPTMTQQHGGLGAGLYIARRMVESMSGRIWAASTRGEGSEFYIAVAAGHELRARGIK